MSLREYILGWPSKPAVNRPPADATQSQIAQWNEATKLTAGFFNTLATSSMTLGVLGPIAAYVFTKSVAEFGTSTIFAFSGYFCLAVILHLYARSAMKKLW